MARWCSLFFGLFWLVGLSARAQPVRSQEVGAAPYVVVLGVAQDGGVPQAGTQAHPGWEDAARRQLVVCLGLVDPTSQQRWMVEATPDFRQQLHRLDVLAPMAARPGLDGLFLTHAHVGHYMGLLFLGHESMGAQGVPVYAMPLMRAFLETNGPWDQLVRYGNIVLDTLEAGRGVVLNERVTVTPFLVPHRQEYSEVVGFRIEGPSRSVLFVPDIDSWGAWDAEGTSLEAVLATVDVAYLDATFFADGELPGRDMSGFPHPFLTHTMDRLDALPVADRAKVRFIHFNHTNPVLQPDAPAREQVEARGYRLAREMERVTL